MTPHLIAPHLLFLDGARPTLRGSRCRACGAVYFPSQEIDYNGTGNTNAVCTLLISKRVTFSGNSGTTNKFKSGSQCSTYGMAGLTGGRRVRLVA